MSRKAVIVGLTLALAVGFAVAVALAVGGGVRTVRLTWVIIAVAGVAVSVLAAASLAVAASHRGKGARTVARELDAQRLGFEYRARGDKSFRQRFTDLGEVPRSATIKHVHVGTIAGRPAAAFESSYTVSTGQAPVQVVHTIYAVESPPWPTTNITPRNWFARLARSLGARTGLELDDPEFNRRFKVTTDSEDFAIALLSPDMQAFLLSKLTAKWRITPGRLCLVYSGTLKTDRMEASLRRLGRFWALVPGELESW